MELTYHKLLQVLVRIPNHLWMLALYFSVSLTFDLCRFDSGIYCNKRCVLSSPFHLNCRLSSSSGHVLQRIAAKASILVQTERVLAKELGIGGMTGTRACWETSLQDRSVGVS